ncbi:hypothetical protein PG994_001712 [Apiospora phragmitis]|uniref:Uncharacterized protein n=1 Tax=Apiospora phragmitis TaxID=2905665 RepID=A0ABR1WUA8_9PEZI
MKFNLLIAALSGIAGLVSGGPVSDRRRGAMVPLQIFPSSQEACVYYMYCSRCDAYDATCDGNGGIVLTNPDCAGDCYCELVCF